MSRFIQLPIVVGGVGQDPMLTTFLNALDESLSEVEIKATDGFIKKLRRSDILNKIVYLHPFLGSTVHSKSFNLINPTRHNIEFTSPVTSVQNGVVFNAGKGTISELSVNSTNLFIALYASNVVSASIFDIANARSGTRVLLVFYGGNTIFDVGWSSGTANEITMSMDQNNSLVLGNVMNGTMSLWQDSTKVYSKAGGIVVSFPTLTYNTSEVNNSRIYKFSILGNGLTDAEVPLLSQYVNEYMTALGRNA